MRYASIDVGTNTILMLIGDVDREGEINPVKDFYSVPRLGKSVSATGRLADESISRAIEVLKGYNAAAREYEVDRIVASATSAVRDASNRHDFISSVKDLCGISIEVIDGDTEAKLGFLGAVSGAAEKESTSLVIDIGGGSTEFSYGRGMDPSLSKSLNIGAVRITEMFLKHNPPSDDELLRADDFISDALKDFPFAKIAPDRVFAVAGTATTLALIAQNRYDFRPEAVNNFRMPVESLREVFTRIQRMSPPEIRKLTEAAQGREDVILAGALILIKSLEAAGTSECLSTDRGLRYGYLLHKHLHSEIK